MKEYTTEFIRNIALVGHGSSGKTMMTEAFLHFSGATTRIGKVEDGSTTSYALRNNTYLFGWLLILVKYGKYYLSDVELDRRKRQQLNYYYQ